MPAISEVRAHAFANSNFFVRHHNGEGEINELDPNHLGDFNFTLVKDTATVADVEKLTIQFRGSFGPFTEHFFDTKIFGFC
jgi:hypothetical protein